MAESKAGTQGAKNQAVEPLKAVARSADGVSVTVYTGGCTQKSHFSWQKTTGQPVGAPTELTLVRNTPDKCYAHIPDGMVIAFSYGELGVNAKDSFTIGNPVVAPGVDPGS